jgi:hypothetical protein
MLSFGKKEIFWQCSEVAACELFPDQGKLRFGRSDGRFTNRHPFWLLRELVAVPGLSALDMKERWLEALETFCRSQLTYPEKDLFAALDGIGTQFGKLSGSLFRHGILASAFLETLLFVADPEPTHDNAPDRVPRTTRPTWHWSSSYPKLKFRVARSFYSRRLIYNRGLYRHGLNICPMAYAFMSDDCRPLPSDSSNDYWPNVLLIGRLLEKKPPYVWCRFDDERDEIAIDPAFGQTEEFYLPFIGSMTTPKDEIYRFLGLILIRAESGSRGAYRRKGVFEFWGYRETLREILAPRLRIIVLE